MSFLFASALVPHYLPDTTSSASHRLSRGLGLCLMLSLHLLGLWLLLAPDAPELLPPSAGNEVLTYVAPLAIAPPSAPIPPQPQQLPSRSASPRPPPAASQEATRAPAPRKPRRAPAITARTREPSAVVTIPAMPQSAPEPIRATTPEPPSSTSPPDDDFSARLDAARKRREAASQNSPETAEADESESQRADRIARDNIAFQQRGQGAQRDQSGGVFQLRSVRLHNAQFMFRGWNTNFKRDSAQLVEVEQGSEPDIETAVVKRMIALIRTQKPGKFVWKSIRAGRLVNLDASPGYDEELQQFLLKEFFPGYLSGPSR
ncbi:MAG: hypothetical protein V4695_07690 [Pseudomonadota bacterium]